MTINPVLSIVTDKFHKRKKNPMRFNIRFDARFKQAVMKSCGLTAGECMTALLNLEMQGLILQPMNQYYVRKIV